MKQIIIFLMTGLFMVPAFASFTKLGECMGVTESGDRATMKIFVDDDNDNAGFLSAHIEGVWDYLSETSINWDTEDGYPQVHENDFDLDIIITDERKTSDDVIIEDYYVERLVCEFTPQ